MAYTQVATVAIAKLAASVADLDGGTIKYLSATDDVLVSIGLDTPAVEAAQVGTLNMYSEVAAPVSGGVGATWAGFLAEVLLSGTVDRVAFCAAAGAELLFPAVGTDWPMTSATLTQGEYILFSTAPVIREPFVE